MSFCGEGDRRGGEEGEGEGEGGGGEDGEGFAEDVGCCFGVEEVRVELVSVGVDFGVVSGGILLVAVVGRCL